jgi:homoserine kinase
VIVARVPASTANLGPGFDALGMALSITADIALDDGQGRLPGVDGALEADEHHPASIAFAAAGGTGRLWVRSPIPMARGMGYSGAMRVGGAAVALGQRLAGDAESFAQRRREVLPIATRLEGHADNVAASLLGGVVATGGALTVRVPTPLRPDVVLWIPPSTTHTSASRSALPHSVPLDDAVFNIGRTALLVAALAAGDVDALRAATEDRLHQERRFVDAEGSRAALVAGVGAGAWCGWLSGSGPTVAMLAAPGTGERVAAALPEGGQAKVVGVDQIGTVLVDSLDDRLGH